MNQYAQKGNATCLPCYPSMADMAKCDHAAIVTMLVSFARASSKLHLQAKTIASISSIATLLFLTSWQSSHAEESPTATPLVAPAPIEARLISDSEISDYLEFMTSKLLMSRQETDPFGSLQDPDAAPKISPIEMPDMPTMPVMTTPFEDVVRMIQVTTVMPGERKFLIGGRSFRVNDVITINYRGQPVRARVEEVSSRQIRFRNVESNDVATRTLEMLPAGMTSGGDSGRSVPGMVPTGPDAPINLD